MSSDLLFSILPRLGKEPLPKDEHIVEQVSKEARLRELNDEEKQLNAEEREAREKYQRKKKKKKAEQQSKQNTTPKSHNYIDKDGNPHIDDYA